MNFGNLGIALGAFTDEQKAQAEEARKAKQFAQQEKDWRRQDEVDERLQKAHDFYNSGLQAIEKGEIGAFAPRAVDYLNSTDYMGKAKGAYLQGADGKHYVTYHDGNAYGPPQTHEITPEMARSALAEMYQHQLAAADPRQAFANNNAMETMGLRRKEVGFKGQEVADKGAYQRGIVDWHNRQADRPQFMQDGTGRVMAISPDGRLLGTYGSARPDHAGAQYAQMQEIWKAQKALNEKYAPLFDAAQKELDEAYAGGNPQAIRAAQAKAKLVNSGYQRELVTKNPSAGQLRLDLPTEPNSKGSTPIEVEVPSADGKGTVKVKTTMDEAVANGWVNAPLPLNKRSDPRGKAAAGGIPAYAEDAPTLTLADQLAANSGGSGSAGVAPGGFYGTRSRWVEPEASPSAFTPGTGLSLQDLMVPRKQR